MSKTASVDVILNGEQAKAALKEIQSELVKVKTLKDKAMSEGDVKGYNQLNSEFKKLTTEAGKFQKQAFDVNDVLKNLSSSSIRDLNSAYQVMNRELKEMKRNDPGFSEKQKQVKSLKDEINSTNGSTEGRMGSLITKAQMAYFAVAAAIGAVVGFAKAAYKAYEEQEIANKRLLFSLQGNKTAFNDLSKQAGDLQKRLGIPDETINQIQMLAAETGKTVPQIKKITEAAIELSIATGDDLQASYMKLNATFTGSAGRLNRLDADFSKLSKTQLENGAAIDLVLTKYGGLAEESASPIKKLSVAWGELLESVGSSGSALEPFFNFVSNWVYDLGLAFKTIKQIKAEVAADNAADQVNHGIEGIQMTKDDLIRKGMSAKLADQKAYDSYIATSNITLKAEQERQLQYLVDSTVLTGKAKTENDKKIKSSEKYIKSVEDEVAGVKKSRAAIVPYVDETASAKAARLKEKAAKESEDAYKLDQDILKKNIESTIGTMKEGTAKELAELKAKYDAEKELINHELETNTKLTPEQKTTLKNTSANLDTKYNTDQQDINKKLLNDELQFQNKLIALKLETAREGTFGEYNLKKEQIENNRQIELAGIKETGEKKIALEKAINDKFNQEVTSLDQTKNLAILSQNVYKEGGILNKAYETSRRTLLQQYNEGKLTKKQYADQLYAIDSKYERDILAVAVDEAQKKLNILKETGLASLAELQQAQDALDAATKASTTASTGKGKTPAAKGKGFKGMEKGDIMDFGVQAAGAVADTIFQIEANKNQRILDDKLSKLNTQREKELENKNLTEAQKEAINNKYDAKERKLKAEAWQKQHKADIIQSIVKGALGVLTGLSQGGVPGAILAGVIAAAEIIMVASQKQPEFYEGGFTTKDLNDRTPAGIVHANEFIGSAKAVRNPTIKPIFDVINYAQKTGAISTLNLPAILSSGTNRVFSSGGYTSVESGPVAPGSGTGASHNLSKEALSITREIAQQIAEEFKNGITGKWVLNDLETIQNDKRNIQSATDM